MIARLRERARQHTAGSIDRALLRVRILTGLAALIFASHAFVRNHDTRSLLAVLAAATVIGFIPGERSVRKRLGVLRTSVVVASTDTLLVIATIGLLDVRAGDPISLLLLLPLVQAGVRHGTLGAFTAWFAVAAAVIGRTIVEWDGTPGQVTGPMIFVIILLLVALPSAGLGDHLADRMHQLDQAAARVDARADALANVLEGSIAIAKTPLDWRTDVIVAHARRLVRGQAELVPFDTALDLAPDATGHDPAALLHDIDGRQMVRIPIGGTPPMVLTAGTDSIDDLYSIEALELLGVIARSLASADAPQSEHPAAPRGRQPVAPYVIEPLDDDATVANPRSDTDSTIRLSRRIRSSDPGVYDRPGIERYLAARLAEGEVTQLALVALDNLKLINDLDGRDAGNALIAAVGSRLSVITSTLAIAWLGGDEFLVVADVADPMKSLRSEIRHALEGRVDIGTATPTAIHSSVGVAVGSDGETAPQLVRQARESMFADKRKQNRIFLDQVEIELAAHMVGMA